MTDILEGYSRVVWYADNQYEDGSGCWFASVDAYPDQFTNGHTVEEAVSMSHDLLQTMIDHDLERDKHPPEPTKGGWAIVVMYGGMYPSRFAHLHDGV